MLAAKGMPRQEQVWKLAVLAKEARGQGVAFLAHCIFSTRRTRFGAVTKVHSHSLGVLVLESTFWPSLTDSPEKEQLSVIQHKTLSKLSGNFVFNICLFEHQKDRQGEGALIHFLVHSQMTSTVRAGPGQSPEPGPARGLPPGPQGHRHLDCLPFPSRVWQQGARLGAEQQGLEPAPCADPHQWLFMWVQQAWWASVKHFLQNSFKPALVGHLLRAFTGAHV